MTLNQRLSYLILATALGAFTLAVIGVTRGGDSWTIFPPLFLAAAALIDIRSKP